MFCLIRYIDILIFRHFDVLTVRCFVFPCLIMDPNNWVFRKIRAQTFLAILEESIMGNIIKIKLHEEII